MPLKFEIPFTGRKKWLFIAACVTVSAASTAYWFGLFKGEYTVLVIGAMYFSLRILGI